MGKKLKTERNLSTLRDGFSHIYEKQQTSENLMKPSKFLKFIWDFTYFLKKGESLRAKSDCLLMKLIGSRVNHLMNWEKETMMIYSKDQVVSAWFTWNLKGIQKLHLVCTIMGDFNYFAYWGHCEMLCVCVCAYLGHFSN